MTHNQPLYCQRCLMDSTALDFTLYDDNTCNFCSEFLERNSNHINAPYDTIHKLSNQFEHIRSLSSKKKKYDCLIGISGGVDSSWVLHLAVQHGLRPLVVHFDNTWNSGLATRNVRNIVETLDVDLVTYIVNYEKSDRALKAFLDLDILDLELLTDHLLISLNFSVAALHGIKYILSGDNIATEGVLMPSNWNWFKYDFVNINSILHANGVKVHGLPLLSFSKLFYYKFVRRIRWLSPLNTVTYVKDNAIDKLVELYDYQPYPYKHYESILTRFYQGYILPQKGNIDKRRVHLSTLVLTNQISRSDALALLQQSPYLDHIEQYEDLQFFRDKLYLTQEYLDDYLHRPFQSHLNYMSILPLWRKLRKLVRTPFPPYCLS